MHNSQKAPDEAANIAEGLTHSDAFWCKLKSETDFDHSVVILTDKLNYKYHSTLDKQQQEHAMTIFIITVLFILYFNKRKRADREFEAEQCSGLSSIC